MSEPGPARKLAGADLPGANFDDRDLRGRDFTEASLVGATFRRARLGTTRWWLAGVLLVSFSTGAASGAVVSLVGRTMWQGVSSGDPQETAFAAITLTIFALFVGTTVFRGLGNALRTTTIVVSGTMALLTIAALSLDASLGDVFLIGATVALLALGFVAGAIARVAAGTFGTATFVLVSLAAALLAWLNGGGLFVMFSLMITVFVAHRALAADTRHGLIRRLSVEVVGTQGTRFAQADLTNADFTDAFLGVSDFRGACLEGARFEGARITPGAIFDPETHPDLKATES